MLRSSSPFSDHDDNTDNALQEEYEKLLSQLRVAKAERIKYINQTNYQLAKCENEFRWLQQENENLKLELSLIESGENKRKDAKVLDGLKSSADTYENLVRQLEQHKQILFALDIDIKNCENRLKKLRSKEKLNLAELTTKLKTKMQIIENKLEKKEYTTSKQAREIAEQSLHTARAELTIIQSEVEGLFRAAQLPLEAVTDPLLPSESTIGQENLLLYLTAVEKRIDDLLKLRGLLGKEASGEINETESSRTSENETPQSTRKSSVFSLPSARDDAGNLSDDSGADLRLLTHEEINRIIIKE
ncbi:unnamed protein product [Dibothriocephalus latus]|uniref:Uncharacterized protein n=1 Tax=Dibothriocephalus latus TaxID=60516 RepID=A0A3P7LB73_DIBLA|nr:unnamed protein product [Dibothriocephalus latus]